jgi:hypothetical protein
MRASGVRGLLVYCSDYKCSHWTRISADQWPDETRLSDLEGSVRMCCLSKAWCRCQAGFRLASEGNLSGKSELQLGERMQRQHFIAVIAITIALVLIAAFLWHVVAD